MTRGYAVVKRAIDLFLSLATLVCISPLLLLLMWLVRRDSPGPALFAQTRAGLNAKPFTLYKLRTMRTDADPYGDSPREGDDPRITKLGKFLRESSLDELPQLLNVVRGEMSLVGPRPLYIQQIAEWDERQRGRLLVKPGLTGYAQIRGRGSLTIEAKLALDVEYVEQVSLRTDIGVILSTFSRLIRKEGIYEVKYSENVDRRTGR